MGFWAGSLANGRLKNLWGVISGGQGKVITVTEESAVISAVDKVAPAVVSIIVTKDLPKIEQYYSNPFGSEFFREFFGQDFNDLFGQQAVPQYRQNGTEKTEIGGGTGFIVSADGYIITNRHVVLDQAAEYTVLMNDEAKYPAKVLARDALNDLAVLKIEKDNLPTVELGDSANLKVGQSVIAIGNALGEFRNTVSTGVISGLARSVTAGGAGIGSEQLINVIQTDASINPGNSGGPLLNIAGQVIGINTAMAQGAQNIGFAIPINEVKSTIESVQKNGRIVRPWLGVRYVIINKAIADANKLSVDYGAIIVRGQNRTDLAVIPGSPADKAGLVENDIILEINPSGGSGQAGQKITEENLLANLVVKFKPGDEITLRVMHQGKEKVVKVKLEEMK
ncbi:trypsin-like serine protease [Candidatus Falkowbacteria bacterium]|nr:trypsin-like serine protease [Candidatus Falkowbacteria bacterium]